MTSQSEQPFSDFPYTGLGGDGEVLEKYLTWLFRKQEVIKMVEEGEA